MHQTMERLYEAARVFANVVGQSALARRLNISPQTVNNWESRGLPASAALRIQGEFGVNANWLLNGSGSMHLRAGWPFSADLGQRVSELQPEQLEVVENLIRAYMQMPMLPPAPPKAAKAA